MKKVAYSLLFLFCLNFLLAQKVEFKILLKDNISIRALQIFEGKVWYSGTDSKFGYVNLKDSANKKQIKLSDKKLEFRTLAQNQKSFLAINIGSPATFFKVDKRTLKSEMVNEDNDKSAFYDALYFYKNKFYTFSDPNDKLDLKFSEFSIQGQIFDLKSYPQYKVLKGEAAFAASNTSIAASGNFLWLATGGVVSRIFRLDLKSRKFEIFETPFVQGTSSQGIYSIDFFDNNFGIAVGGDYTKQAENINNIATTRDGGKTWQIQASGKNAGYKTCVKFRPKSKGRDIIAVGDQNIEFSSDYGKTWKIISEEKGLYVCEWINENTAVFAGKNRIITMKIY